MNPGTIVALMLVAGVIGSLGYSYHVGRTQGESICEAAFLEAKLKQKEEELKLTDALAKFQQEQLGEAQTQLIEESKRNASLKENLDKAFSIKPTGCITPGMRDAIEKYRIQARDKNS